MNEESNSGEKNTDPKDVAPDNRLPQPGAATVRNSEEALAQEPGDEPEEQAAASRTRPNSVEDIEGADHDADKIEHYSTTEGVTDTATSSMDEFGRLEKLVVDGLERIHKSIQDRLSYDGYKEQQLERLHREVVDYRNGRFEKADDSWAKGLIQIHDNVGKIIDGLRKKTDKELTPETFFKAIAGICEEVEIMLDDHDVTAFEDRELNDKFNPRRQRAIARTVTSQSDKFGCVARRLRPGFERDGRILSKERVEVYVAEPKETAGSNGDVENENPPADRDGGKEEKSEQGR